MKYCQKHWDAMRAAIDVRGMSHCVAKNGLDAMEVMIDTLVGAEPKFDPLLGAHNQIAAIVVERMPDPIAALVDPEWCPLCEIQQSYDWWEDPQHNPDKRPRPENARDAQGWIDGTMDSALTWAIEQGIPGIMPQSPKPS